MVGETIICPVISLKILLAQALFKQQSFPFVYIHQKNDSLIKLSGCCFQQGIYFHIPIINITKLKMFVLKNKVHLMVDLLQLLIKMSKTSASLNSCTRKVQISDAKTLNNTKKSTFSQKREQSSTTKRSSAKSIKGASYYQLGSDHQPDLFWNYSVTPGDIICNTALLKCFKQSSTQENTNEKYVSYYNPDNNFEKTQVDVLTFRKEQRAMRRLKKKIKDSQATHFCEDVKSPTNYLKPPLEIVIEEKSPQTPCDTFEKALPITIENLDLQGESFHFQNNKEGSEIPEVLTINIPYERIAAVFSPTQSFLSGQGIIKNTNNSDLATAENSSNAAPQQNSNEKPIKKPRKYRYHKQALLQINNKNDGVDTTTAKAKTKVQLDPLKSNIQSPCFSQNNGGGGGLSDLSSFDSKLKNELIKESTPLIISPVSPNESLSQPKKKANRLQSQGVIEVPKFLAPLSEIPNTQENNEVRINTQRQTRVKVLASDRRSFDSSNYEFDVASGFGMESMEQLQQDLYSPRTNNNKLSEFSQQTKQLPMPSKFKQSQIISSTSNSKAQLKKNPHTYHTSTDWKKSLKNISNVTTKNFKPDILNQELHKLSQNHPPLINEFQNKLIKPAKTMSKFFSTQRNSIDKSQEDNQLKFPIQVNKVTQKEIEAVNINVSFHQAPVKPPRKLSKLSPQKENCKMRKTLKNHQNLPSMSQNSSQSPPQQLRYSRKYNPKQLKAKIQKAMENISSPAVQTASENASSAGYSLNSQTQGLQGQGGCYHQDVNKLLSSIPKTSAQHKPTVAESSKQANSAIHNSRLLIIAEEEAHDNSVLSCSMFSVSQQSSHRNPCMEMNQTTGNINSLFPDSNDHQSIEENKIQIKRFRTQKDRKLTKPLGCDINMSIEGESNQNDEVPKNEFNVGNGVNEINTNSHQKHYPLNRTYLEMSPEYIQQNCAGDNQKTHFKKRNDNKKSHKPSFQTSVKFCEASLTSSQPWQAIKNKKLKRELLNRIYQFAPNVTSHIASTENFKQSSSVCKVSNGTKVITVTDIGGMSQSMLASTNDVCKMSSNDQQKLAKPKTARIKTSHNNLKLQKLYKGQDGEWLGKMAGIKRRNKVGTSLRSKKVFQDIVRNVSKAITPRKPTTDLLSAYTSSVCSDTLSSLNFDISQHGYHNRYNQPPSQAPLESSQGNRDASSNDISVIQSVKRFKTLRKERGKVCSNSRKDSRSLFNNIDQIVHDLKESTRQLEQILIKEREHHSFRRPSSSDGSIDPLLGSSCVLNITNKKVRYEENGEGLGEARMEEDSDEGLEEDPDIDEDNVKIQ